MEADMYQELCMRTAKLDLFEREELINCALGLGEAGEVQNIIKKHVFHGHNLDKPGILDECGDMLFYISWLLNIIGMSLSEAMEHNINKLQKRYPDGFDTERSIHRDE